MHSFGFCTRHFLPHKNAQLLCFSTRFSGVNIYSICYAINNIHFPSPTIPMHNFQSRYAKGIYTINTFARIFTTSHMSQLPKTQRFFWKENTSSLKLKSILYIAPNAHCTQQSLIFLCLILIFNFWHNFDFSFRTTWVSFDDHFHLKF